MQIEFHVSPHGVSTLGCVLRLTSRYRLDCGEPLARLYDTSTAYLLCYTGVADFVVRKTGQRIDAYRLEGASATETRLHLLGGVLSFALELQGIRALHASAFCIAGSTVAFLGDTGSGKSTLAAAFVKASYSLLTDDVLALMLEDGVIWGYPGYPQMKIWPDEVKHFLGHHENLECVLPTLAKRRVPVGMDGFGTFCDEPQPLACIYLPVRRNPTRWGTRIVITPLSLRDAMIELTRHSYTPRAVEAIGLQPQRLDFFAHMVQRVPVRRIVYPAGLEHLPDIREAILADLDAVW